MRLSINPPNASVQLDGQALAIGTEIVRLPVGEGLHELRVDADGYVGQVQSFTVSGPTTLAVIPFR